MSDFCSTMNNIFLAWTESLLPIIVKIVAAGAFCHHSSNLDKKDEIEATLSRFQSTTNIKYSWFRHIRYNVLRTRLHFHA